MIEDISVDKPWLMMGDCLERMKEIPGGSVDMILADLPYGTTRCKWDSIIDLKSMWSQYSRIIKTNGAIALTASQPFTSALVMSNPKMFRYELIWEKQKGSDPLNARRKPMKRHESIIVFWKKQACYNPQMTKGTPYSGRRDRGVKSVNWNHAMGTPGEGSPDGLRFPTSVLRFSNEGMNCKNLHSTQKPLSLFEYLIRTHSNPGDIILDNCFGSGTTGVACVRTYRRFIGIESDEKYFNVGVGRMSEAIASQEIELA